MYAKENVQHVKSYKCIFAKQRKACYVFYFLNFYEIKMYQKHYYYFTCKNGFDAKMHLVQKFIFAKRTFYYVKCSACKM